MPPLHDAAVLVTGAGGFIGRRVVRALLSRGASVRALAGAPGQCCDFDLTGIQTEWSDINDSAALSRLMEGVQVVVHLAGPPGVARSYAIPDEYRRVHVRGTESVLAAMTRTHVQKIVYISSAEVYGRPVANPVPESAAPAPRSPYAKAKLEAEGLVHDFARANERSAMVLRPFSIYGEGVSAESLLGTLVGQARAGGPVVLADLRPVRDYCHVDDLCEAIVRCCSIDCVAFDTFNISAGRATSVLELAEHVIQILGLSTEIREDPSRRRPDANEILELWADVSHAAHVLDWTAATSLTNGLRNMLLSEHGALA